MVERATLGVTTSNQSKEERGVVSRIAVFRPSANDEINGQAEYYEDVSGEALADRFIDAVFRIFEKLARNPGLGAPWITDNLLLQGVRKYRVAGFPSHLLFYRADQDKTEILHLIHASRDIEAILGGRADHTSEEPNLD